MSKIQINNKDYHIPESISGINIQQFIAVQEIIQNEELSNLKKHLQIISYLTQIPEGVLRDTGMDLIGILLHRLKWLFEVDMENIQADTSFEFKGEMYFVNQEFSESACGEYIDYDNWIHTHGPLKAIPYCLAVLCKKADEKYNSYNVIQRAKQFQALPADIALGIANFFLKRRQHLNLIIQSCSLTKQALEQQKKDVEHSIAKLDGGGLFAHWQKKMLRKLVKYLPYPSPPSFSSSSTRSRKQNWKRIWKGFLDRRGKEF